MARFVPIFAAWVRHNFTWSNTRRAWQERVGVGFALLAAVAGVLFISRLDAALQVAYWGILFTALALLLRRGWLRLFGPVLFYDLLTLARRIRYFLVRAGYAGFLFFIIGWLWFAYSLHGNLNENRIAAVADFANVIFNVFVSVQFVIVIFLTPIYTASAVADEKERRTLEFLLATDLRNREIVLSKLFSRLLNIGMLILAGLPILALLQFMGGVDPGLVLASYAATLATVASLACLGTLFSVLVRRGRDAILLTYLCVAGYFVGWALQFAIPPSWLSFPSASSPVTLQDVLTWYNAGNILSAIHSLGYLSFRPGVSLYDVLPEVLSGYLIFHGLLALVCVAWAVLRLRAVALKESYGKAQKMRLGVRVFGRPAVSDQPMVWKEVFAEPGLRLHWLGRIILALLVLGSFVPAGFILEDYSSRPSYYWVGYDPIGREMNVWGRVVGAMVGSVLLLGVAVRAAGSISGERDRQTLDSLLTTPLDSNAILRGKWLGSILSMRRGWLWLAAIYGLTLVCGGVNVIGLLLVIVAWFVFAAFVAMLGLWFSTTCCSTMRATVGTLLALLGCFGGHWLLWFCCLPCLWGSPGEIGEVISHVAAFQLFALTPPATLGELVFRAEELESGRSWWNPVEHLVMAIIGLVLWSGLTAMLYTSVSARLRALTLRADRLQPEPPPPGHRRRSQHVSSYHLKLEETGDSEEE